MKKGVWIKESITDKDIMFKVGSTMKEVSNLNLSKQFDYIFDMKTAVKMIQYICDELDVDYRFHAYPKFDKYQVRIDFFRNDILNVGYLLLDPVIEDVSSLTDEIEAMLKV